MFYVKEFLKDKKYGLNLDKYFKISQYINTSENDFY